MIVTINFSLPLSLGSQVGGGEPDSYGGQPGTFGQGGGGGSYGYSCAGGGGGGGLYGGGGNQ